MARQDNIENYLGLYPSSSDEEIIRRNSIHGWAPTQPSVPQTSQETNEVINRHEPQSANVPAAGGIGAVAASTASTSYGQRREQARLDHNLFWSAVGNPQRLNIWIRPAGTAGYGPRAVLPAYGRAITPGPGRSPGHGSGPGPGRGTGPGPSPSARTEARSVLFGFRASEPASRSSASGSRAQQPVPELRHPPLPPSATADIISIMAFKRLQRYRHYRRNRATPFGLVSRLPQLGESRESSPRAGNGLHRTSHRASYSRSPGFPAASGAGDGAGPSAGAPDPEPDRSDPSADETESVRLSPRLPVPPEEPADNNLDNMEVEEPRPPSPQEDETGEGEEESDGEGEGEGEGEVEGEEGRAAAASAAPPGRAAAEEPTQVGNNNGRLLIDIRMTARGLKRRREAERQQAESFDGKELNQNLLRLLECPVCLEWMEPPMLQCRLGHLVCPRCRARLTTCPVCRSGFSSVRNRAMEGVAELLRYPCRHGCGREARLRRREAHEASCPRRRYRCAAHMCAERAPLPYDDLVRHIQRNHAAMIKTGREHTFSVKVNAQQHDNWFIMAGFGLFHLRVAVDIRTWSILAYVAYIGPKCRANEFTYVVTIVGSHNGRRLVYSRATHSDLESASLNVSRQDCFHITLDEAINFLRFRNRHCQPDRLLDFTVEITKQETTADGADNNSAVSDE